MSTTLDLHAPVTAFRSVAVQTSDKEERVVEAILLEHIPEGPPASLRAIQLSSSCRLLNALRRALRLLLVIATTSFFVILIAAHLDAAHVNRSLPAFCRLPGMEPYEDTSHCFMDLEALGLDPMDDGIPTDLPLLDGPPPPPLYWADFPELYRLQRRMIECMFNASAFEGTIPLKFVYEDIDNRASSMFQLRMELQHRDYMKERVLRDTLYDGARLGRKLARMHREAKKAVEAMVRSAHQASQGIEDAAAKQPRSLLAQAVIPLFPRSRSSYWTWDTDIEVRWQFYDSLTSFSGALYESLLALGELVPRLEAYEQDLASLQSLLAEKENQSISQKAASLFAWSKLPLPKKHLSNVDKSHEELKEAILGRLARERRVAFNGASSALTALRSLSEELESVRSKLSKPGRRIPFYLHLKHIYIEGKSLASC